MKILEYASVLPSTLDRAWSNIKLWPALSVMAIALCSLLAVSLSESTVIAEPASSVLRVPVSEDSFWKSRLAASLSTAVLVDCNGNGIDDEDDIEDCKDDPACDDCNLNDVPDGCDITAGTSGDLDVDGVPDECVFYDDGGVGDDWSTDENWDDDDVPDNLDEIDDESVTIDVSRVNLDIVVEVDTLRLRDGSTLLVAGSLDEDFEVEEEGGILIQSDTGVISQLLVGDGREIQVTAGTMEIKSGGLYASVGGSRSASGGGGTLQAFLEVGNVLIESRCGEPIPGEMRLTDQMTTFVLGDLVIDATQDCVVCSFCSQGARSDARSTSGGETPPILQILGDAVLQIDGTLAILGPGQIIHESTAPIEIGGDFVNQSPCPECSRLAGTIIMGPTTGGRGAAQLSSDPPQHFEVGGVDMGPVTEGLNVNFAVSVLEISQGVTLALVDTFSNSGSAAPEALYVDTLILRQNSTLVLGDNPVYYNTLIDEGGTVDAGGAGALTRMAGVPAIPTAGSWGLVAMLLTMLTAATLAIRASHAVRRVTNRSPY